MKRALILLITILCWSATPALAQFDSSEYRQNTYGPPTHYCDPARSLSNPGAGTLANPWNLLQAMNLAVAGNVVGFLPGVGVRMPTTNNDNLPTFRPQNSGTASNRVVFVTRFAAVALPNVATNPNRTELRHDGTRSVANGASDIGTGSPMYGAYQVNYLTFDGFFVDMAQAQPKADSGVIRVENATGTHFRNFEIKGTLTNMGSNPIIYRPQHAFDTVLSNFRAYDFQNDTTNAVTQQRAHFSDQYGDQNFLIEHFELSNIQNGIFLKGTSNPLFNYGTIRYGIVRDTFQCFRFNDLDPTRLTTLEYSVCHDVVGGGTGSGITLSSETTPVRNLLIHHMTIARMHSNEAINGGIYAKRSISNNVVIRDNIFEMDNGPNGYGMSFGEVSTLPATLDFNGYSKNGATVRFAFNGVDLSSITAWRTATGRDTNSQILGAGLFVNRAAADFRVAPGHPAMTASSTGGQLGAYAAPAGVTIGVVVEDSDTPFAPTGLRIVGTPPGQ